MNNLLSFFEHESIEINASKLNCKRYSAKLVKSIGHGDSLVLRDYCSDKNVFSDEVGVFI